MRERERERERESFANHTNRRIKGFFLVCTAIYTKSFRYRAPVSGWEGGVYTEVGASQQKHENQGKHQLTSMYKIYR